ncbi:hypothetical protein L7F22_054002 [Adiantum nelumboides]|nr:hypothetical protein [Adiantum nelumboides]
MFDSKSNENRPSSNPLISPWTMQKGSENDTTASRYSHQSSLGQSEGNLRTPLNPLSMTPRTSPELSSLFGRAPGSSSPMKQRTLFESNEEEYPFAQQGRNMATSSSSSGYISADRGKTSLSGFRSAGGGLPLTSAVEDDDDRLFFERESSAVPRRNHTIASSASNYRKRLDRQFPPYPLTSPSKNSLSDITGGKEEGEDDWEAMMKRKESLIPNVEEETEVLETSSTWQPASFSMSAHRRYPSQPISTFGTSPIETLQSSVVGGERSNNNHQRSESAHVNRLDQGPFASSPIIPGRQAAGRMRQEHTQPAIGSGIQSPTLSPGANERPQSHSPMYAIGAGFSSSDSNRSPIGPQSATEMFNMRSSDIAKGRNIEEESMQQSDPTSHSSSTQLSTSLMDVHAQMSQMSLHRGEDASLPQFSTLGGEVRPKLPSLITNRDALAQRVRPGQHQAYAEIGPASASAYVPPIGHGHHREASSNSISNQFANKAHGLPGRPSIPSLRGPQTAYPGLQEGWQFSKERLSDIQNEGGIQAAGVRSGDTMYSQSDSPSENGNMPHSRSESEYQNLPRFGTNALQYNNSVLPPNPSNQIRNAAGLPANPNDLIRMGAQLPAMYNNNLGFAYPSTNGLPQMMGQTARASPSFAVAQQVPVLGPLGDPSLDPRVRSLILSKGYNPSPSTFNVNPPQARFFVIKSFTEDDVQRSLKHEIWASTEKGNQRLDRAFKESNNDGPLYLFFSVNASGHFCGVAEMLTPIDYSSNSNVWVQEGKWKGTFKVKWIYVKDVPNNKLRHIRLTNTTECKPITQSRDTQELPSDGGRQALKIIAEYQSRTTLLQDWLFYERQAVQHNQQQTQPLGDRSNEKSEESHKGNGGRTGSVPMRHTGSASNIRKSNNVEGISHAT